MTKEELLAAVKGFATGENADTVASVTNEITALYTTIDTANTLHQQDAKKISDLNDTNMKLFLRVTGNAPEQKQEEEHINPADVAAAFMNIAKENKNADK